MKRITIVLVGLLWCCLTLIQCQEIKSKEKILLHLKKSRDGIIYTIPVAGYYKIDKDSHFLMAGDKVIIRTQQVYEIEKIKRQRDK